jgi:subtilisin family serine protease
MANKINSILLVVSFLFISNLNFSQKLGFKALLEKNPNGNTTFCVPYNIQNLELLERENVTIKYSSKNWIFITTTPEWINDKHDSKELTNYYFEFAPPSLMSDSARAHHFVNEVHAGTGGLESGFTGKGVVIGIVDTGVDFNHPDFIDSSGVHRTVRFWDQTMPDNASSPQPYGYGFVWDSLSISNGTCTSNDASGHGTTVAGQAAGNGLACGQNKGMAPEATIIAVKTDFNRQNWTLTVADACDYIFKVADSLGMPAVVNLSLGSYFGSHDGNDPASEIIEDLLDQKPGRIVVSAAGNSGAFNPYHQKSIVTADTNFVWFQNNPTNQLGANKIFFELWTDLSDATFDFAFGADTEGPSWDFRGRTDFHGATSALGGVIYDTIWNNGNRIATIEVYLDQIGTDLQFQLLASIDSTAYRYRFETKGSGKYDLWSGLNFQLNSIYPAAPPLVGFPDSIYYVAPDLNQSIVSSWNCSEKVVSVGNFQNRRGHINKNLVEISYPNPVGNLSPNSSKGPNRHDLQKPNISASGDMSLSAYPLALLASPGWYNSIDSNGWHGRNGGTSLASPVVAGIAALYLERCSRATYQDFMTDLQNSAYSDAFTGTVPNNGYGFGKAHALNTLLEQTIPSVPTIDQQVTSSSLVASAGTYFDWTLNGAPINGENDQTLIITPPYGTYTVEVYNTDGCSAVSVNEIVTAGIDEHNYVTINVYPNPAESNIQVLVDENVETAFLFDLNGNQIQLNRNNGNNFSLNGIAQGVYTLQVTTVKGIFFSKIIRL